MKVIFLPLNVRHIGMNIINIDIDIINEYKSSNRKYTSIVVSVKQNNP